MHELRALGREMGQTSGASGGLAMVGAPREAGSSQGPASALTGGTPVQLPGVRGLGQTWSQREATGRDGCVHKRSLWVWRYSFVVTTVSHD